MKGIEMLPFLTKEQKELLETSERNYKRFARVYFQILSISENEAIVKVWQLENQAKRYLSEKELIDRTKAVFERILPESVQLHVRPVAFDRVELNNFSITDVEVKMNRLGLKPKDLVHLLNINKSQLSLILNKERGLTKSSKAMLYYMFKYIENEPGREPDISPEVVLKV
ncbi:MAG: hypothetical protein LBS69_07785 [Prevotellaceae bacterium]|jgi:hypothetical protein|nr:hypothetical protein [Prevotellaceae bacterium]